MNRKKYDALDSLIQLSQNKGYVLFEDIMNCADEFDLSIQDVDWLSSAIVTREILVYDEAPPTNTVNDSDEYDDFAQTDYDAIFDRVIELSPLMEPFINDVRKIIPPQYRESARLKYQVLEENEYARQRMIEMHLRVAVRIALQRAEAYDLDIDETIGDACVGLINAVDKYDPETSGPFSSYVSYWIFQNIAREQVTRRPLVYYPVHTKEQYYTMYPILKERGCVDCPEWYGCPKVTDMICEKLECTEKKAQDIVAAFSPIDSLDLILENINVCEKQDDYEQKNDMACLYSENMYEDVEIKLLQEDIRKMVGSLKKREREVICARYGLDDGRGKTLDEVGQMSGVTRERIRQIESKALRKLLLSAKKANLDVYL